MTKQMADSLGMNDLDRVKKALKVLKEKEETDSDDEDDFSSDEINFALRECQSLEKALSVVDDPEFDGEMDDIAKDSEEASKELLDLGMQVETKYTAEIVSAAERFKSTQLAAKKAKADRKLKMLDLKLKERRLDLLEQKQNSTLSKGVIDGDGEYFDDDRDAILDGED